MVQIPILIQDAPIVRMTNSVLMGAMRFTLEQFTGFFTASNPAPARLATQLTSFSGKYDVLNGYYASSRESLITQDIAGLDEEGDQLELGFEGVVDASQRMTFDASRKAAADRLALTKKKYKIDVRENMISEWSKIQQMCEEITGSAQLTADVAMLGLAPAVTRLAEISVLIPQKIMERSSQSNDLAAMKSAREAIYPEYRTLIQLLNAFAVVDDDPTRYASLIRAMNDYIDYVRTHSLTGEQGGQSSQGGQNTPTDPTEPGNGDDNDNPNPNPNPNDNPNDNPGGGDDPSNPSNPTEPGGNGGEGDDPVNEME